VAQVSALLLLLLSLPALAKDKPSLADTQEWTHLASVWHLMIDHSAVVIYSPERFKEMAPEMERAEVELTSLVTRGLLSAETGQGLREVFEARYEYIQDHCYPTSRELEHSELTAAEVASHWVTEMQLSTLRDAYRSGEPDRKTLDLIAGVLSRELTFQRQVAALEADQARERQTLTEKDARKEAVDWNKFEIESTRRRALLIESYHGRNLPRDRAIQRLVPSLMDLTKTQPVNSAAVYPFPRVL
jgi:hypothetical protein